MKRLLSALVLSAVSLSGEAKAEGFVYPEDATEILEMLIGQDPSRHATPLAAMHGRAMLYDTYKVGAQNGDETALGIWLVLADLASRSVDASLVQSFAADLVPIYRHNPDGFLRVLAKAPWLAEAACPLLAKHFGSEDRPPEGRVAFLDSESERITAALPGGVATKCLTAFEMP